jgi:alkylhydroperoxidase/carboxymuconolactone decarboxylase family protein YurZ
MHPNLKSAVSLSGMVLASCLGFSAAKAEDPAAIATHRDIEATLGLVPSFFKTFPESGIAGAWDEFKSIKLNPTTKLTGKTKELIGLAVAAQIPCAYYGGGQGQRGDR